MRVVAGALALLSTGNALSLAKQGPVQKVVGLLKDMETQIEKEAKQDEEAYNKMVCWCASNRKEKEASIAEKEALIPELKASIDELNAKFGQMFQEIDEHKNSIEESTTALNTATANREKEAAEFVKLKGEQTTAVSQLRSAIKILERLHGGEKSLLQADNVQKIQDTLDLVAKKFGNIIDKEDVTTATSLLQARPYEAQSGEIFGFLKSMLDSMASNFAEAEAAETKAAAAFDEMKAAKEEQIAAEKNMLADKQQASSEARLTAERTKKQLAQAEAQLEEDRAFLAELEKRCKENDNEWAARSKDRAVEIKALHEAMEVLQSDEMRDLTFVQKFQTRVHKAKKMIALDRATTLLKKVAAKTNNVDISMLATAAQLDGIKKVQEKIDVMIKDIKKQKKDEVSGPFGRDWCMEELQTTETKTKDAEYLKEDLLAKQDQKEMEIKKLTDAIKNLKTEIAQMQVELQAAALERVDNSKVFQQMFKEQEVVVKLLTKAKEKLQQVYKGGAFLQQEPEKKTADIGAPQGLSKGGYKKNASGGGVLGLIDEIIQDAYKVQMDAHTEENEQVAAYGEFLNESQQGIEERSRAVISNTSSKADAEEALESTKLEISKTVKELGLLNQHEIDVHTKCDFLLKNFDVRQQAMQEEIEGLQQAKQILGGMQ